MVLLSRLGSLVLLAAVGLAACDGSTLPADVVEFTPPAIYRTWWAMTSACADRQRSIADIRWYVSTGDQLRSSDGREAGGFYDLDRNRIVLARNAAFDGALVRHEMLHALLRRTRGHPREFFLEKCAGSVYCFEECTASGGPWPTQDPGAVAVPPGALTIGVIGTQDTVFRDSASIYSVTITASNATARPVVIALPASGDAGPPVTFSWSIEGPNISLVRSERLESVGTIRFRANETKRWVVDIRASDLSIGLNEFVGSYGDVTAAVPARVVVMP